jgi:flavin-binding protein dodecin
MSIAKIIEITAESTESFEAAVRDGIEAAGKSVRNIEGAWVKEHKVVVENGKITAFRVDMKVTFLLD